MPNPIDALTKPLQIGARIAFGAFQAAQQAAKGIIGGDHQEEPPRETKQEPREPQGRQAPAKPRSQAAPRQRRNTQPKRLDDRTITDKVETELFRDAKVAKGKIDVNTADGVVWLRGEAKSPEQIKELEAKALAIPEVKQVENLLHLPKTPAPTRADTPKPEQKTRRHKPKAAARKVAPTVAPSERKSTVAGAEPSPKELAAEHKGRQPAPLGSHEPDAKSETPSTNGTTS
ncbi:MAG: hypothetical protein QOF55_272 [Thermoleophilaceae bacterium]|jgi:hypothetical protein|nr:hypothetical protein [Thermoleophilaceae bacterium]